MKKAIITLLLLSLISTPVFAGFKEHYEAGQAYFLQDQYSSAILEFKKALRINYLDNSARIAIINSYLARGESYANGVHAYEKAANDFRSALFYLKYYTNDQNAQNSLSAINAAVNNLSQCFKAINYDTTPKNRYEKAEQLRMVGNFPAAIYELIKASESQNLREDCYSQIGDLMKVLGNNIKAEEYYKKTLDVNPKNGPVRLKYARMLDVQNKAEEALKQYNMALSMGKDDKEILYALERIYLKKLSTAPNDADILANLGAIKQKQGDLDMALSYYSRAEKIDSSNVTTRMNVGTLFQQKKDYDKALLAYNSILALYPENVQAHIYKAQIYSEMGDKAKAKEEAQKVLALDPNNKQAKEQLLYSMDTTMSPKEVMNFLGKTYDKDTADLLYNYAVKLHKDNKIDDAITCYNEVIQMGYNNPDVYINQAICYNQKKQYSNAVNVLKQAQTKFPNNKQVTKALKEVQDDWKYEKFTNAANLYANKDYEKALSMYLAINPATEESLIGAAASYQSLNQPQKAIEYYKKALNLNPNNKEIPYYLAVLYADVKDWQNSKKYINQVLVSNSTHKDASDLLIYVNSELWTELLNSAISNYENGKYDQSLNTLNKLLAENKENSYAYYYRGMIFDAKNNRKEAINDYLNVLKYNKELPIANYLIAVDYDILGDLAKSKEFYEKFLDSYQTQDEYYKYAKNRLEELTKANGNQ